MAIEGRLARAQAILVISILVLTYANAQRGPQNAKPQLANIEYSAVNCRKHSASLTEFGGVGDGKTSNTKAFQEAIKKLSQYEKDGGSLLYVPPGRWLTGSFNLTSSFTLFLDKGAVLLATQNENEWPIVEPLPSYGRGRDAPGPRMISLIFGNNLTDVVITGNNGTLDGQGQVWWDKYRGGKLKYTRPYLIEIMHSTDVHISSITLVNSMAWNIHPVYCRNVLVQGVTILAPITSANTDGIDPDSSSNVRIEDCFIQSGDDCVAVKSGWNQYGIKFNMPTKDVVIRRLTCISPDSAMIALGSEMSGGIQNVRAEDLHAINTQSAVSIKTVIGRGNYVRDIFVRGVKMETMENVFRMSGTYSSNPHPDNNFDPKAIPEIKNINYRDMVAKNVTMPGKMSGIPGTPFKDICLSNITLELAPNPPKVIWNCTDIVGISSGVVPQPCNLLPDKKQFGCNYPLDRLPIDTIKLQKCSTGGKSP